MDVILRFVGESHINNVRQLLNIYPARRNVGADEEANVAIAPDVEGLINTTESTFGRIDCIFNNAGLMHGADDDAINTEEDIWDLTMDVNVKGVWFGCKYGIPALRRAGGGSR